VKPITRLVFKKKSARRKAFRAGLVVGNALLLAAVVLFFVIQPHADKPVTMNSVELATTDSESSVSPLDQLSSANIALTVARMSNLPETIAVTNQADSEDFAVSQAATENSVVATKPQVVASAFKSLRDLKSYKVASGDTVTGIAAKFKVSSNSIRWSNNLTSNSVPAGTVLWIPPVDGIVYVVTGSDTPESIAKKFKADKNKIVAFNDAEIAGLKRGQRIVVPDGTKAAVRATSYSSVRSYSGLKAIYGYNGYDYGYCTWYVASVRSIPVGLGNASTWGYRARAMGLATGSTPQVGAAVVTSTAGAGHVAYVEKVNGDGTIWISEMNSHGQVSMTDSTPAGGWGRRDYKVISAAGKTYIY
jgi:surface antigen